jgi:hypothetical protein
MGIEHDPRGKNRTAVSYSLQSVIANDSTRRNPVAFSR